MAVRLKNLKISSKDIANLNYSILLNTKHGSAPFEDLLELSIFQNMVAYPFNSVQKASPKMVLARRNVKKLLQLEDSDFPPKGERESKFSEPVYDEYMSRFIKEIGEQEVMHIVNTLVQNDYLTIKRSSHTDKRTKEVTDTTNKEYQFLTIDTRNRLTEDRTKLSNLESNLGNILGYEYEQGTQETEEEDNELMDAIDASKPVLFPDILKEHIVISGSGDELKVTIDTRKYFEKLFKDYGFGNINEDNWKNDAKLTNKDGSPRIDKKTGKQKTGRKFTGNFQFPMVEVPKGGGRSTPEKKKKTEGRGLDEYALEGDKAARLREKNAELEEEFERAEGENIENEFRDSTDIEEFIEVFNKKTGKKEERLNPDWSKELDKLHEEKLEEFKEERQSEIEEDLEQFDEDDSNESEEDDMPSEEQDDYNMEIEEKMLKAIEIAKAIFRPTQRKTIKHVLKIIPKSDFKRIKPTPKPTEKNPNPTPSTYADRKQNLDRHEYNAMSYHLDDWDGRHRYDDLDELHEAVQEIEFNERDIKNWVMKVIQDQRKSELKNLVLKSITFEDNILYLGSVEFTLVRYEYDTVDDLELALHGSIEPEATEDFEKAKDAILDQLWILHSGFVRLAEYTSEETITALFTKDREEILSSLKHLVIQIDEDLKYIENWKGESITAVEPGNYRELSEELEDLYFDMDDRENVKFKEAAENPQSPLPELPKSKKYGDWNWVKEQFVSEINSQTREEELVMPKASSYSGESKNRFQKISNKSMSWSSKVLGQHEITPEYGGDEKAAEKDKYKHNPMSMKEQEETLLDMQKVISNPERHVKGGKRHSKVKRKNRGMLELLEKDIIISGSKLDLDVDFVQLWLDHTKGMNILDENKKQELVPGSDFETAVIEELLSASWKDKVSSIGDIDGAGIVLPVIAYRNWDFHDKIKIDTRTHQVKGTKGFSDTRGKTRFVRREGIGRRNDKIIMKDMSILKKIIREFKRMDSMVS